MSKPSMGAAAAGLIAALAMASGSVQAAATEGEDAAASGPILVGEEPGPIDLGALGEAELEDLAWVSKDRGVSIEEAAMAVGWHESFSQAVHNIRNEFPDEFAGARIEASDSSDAWVAFKHAAPQRALSVLGGLGRTIAVHEGRGFSETELAEVHERMHYALYEDNKRVRDVASGYDIATGAIEIDVVWKDASEGAWLSSDTERRLRPKNPHLTVSVSAKGNVEHGNDAAVYGGGAIVGCTSGFTVTAGVGIGLQGLATAGHCSNNQSYGDHSLTFVAEHRGAFGDVQWHSTLVSTPPEFYYNAGHRRHVRWVLVATEGQELCKYGRTTGRTCDEVYRTNECQSGDCRLVAMRGRNASGGDSGGPWYWGNSAYGIHKGYKWIGIFRRDTFSQAQHLPSALGVSVRTQ